MSLEARLNAWMDEHETDVLDLVDEEIERFREAHPGYDGPEVQANALHMANRRFIARALGVVLPEWLERRAR